MGAVGLAELFDALELLAGDTVDDRNLGGELVDLYRARDMLHAQLSRRLLVFDRRGDALGDGFKSTSGWLIANCRVSRGTATRDVRVARHLDCLDQVRGLWEQGRTTSDHVSAIVEARRDAKADSDFDAYEPSLVPVAESCSVVELGAVLARWREALDATHDDDRRVEALIERRGLNHGETMDQGFAKWVMDPTDYAVFTRVLDEEVERGRVEGDTRTAEQQRLDAMIALFVRHLDSRPAGGSNRPHLIIRTDLATMAGRGIGTCVTDSGTTIPVEALRRIACDANLTRVVLDADGRLPGGDRSSSGARNERHECEGRSQRRTK